jgi:hypothetical protein
MICQLFVHKFFLFFKNIFNINQGHNFISPLAKKAMFGFFHTFSLLQSIVILLAKMKKMKKVEKEKI